MREALEAKILARPDDPMTWRVYADWLLDQGDPRGRLIDLELQLETPMPAKPRAQLHAKTVALRRPLQEAWEARAPGGTRLQWRFGFVVGVTLWSWWGEGRELAFLDTLLQDPVGRFLHQLRVRSHCRIAGFGALAAWPGLARIRDLVLADVGLGWNCSYDGVLGQHGLDLLAASPHTAGLRSLDVSGNLLGIPTREPSARMSSGQPYRYPLVPTENKGEVLARMQGLTELRLRGCHLGDACVAALVGPASSLRLSSLELSDNALGPDSARALASSPLMSSLKTLSLRDNPLGPEACGMLQEACADRVTLELGYAEPRGPVERGEISRGVFVFRAHDRHPGGNADMHTVQVTLQYSADGKPLLRAATHTDWDGTHSRREEAPLELDPSAYLPELLAAARQLQAVGATHSRFTLFDARLDSDEYDTEWSSVEIALYGSEGDAPLISVIVEAAYSEPYGPAPDVDPPDAVSQALVDVVTRLCGLGRVAARSEGQDDFAKAFHGAFREVDAQEMPLYLEITG